MQCSENSLSSFAGNDLDLSPCFDVVIAYEDFETGKHAKRTYDFLTEHLHHECTFTNQMWKFDVLAMPNLRQMAAQDAAQADIIIISCHGATALPAEVKAWIELWINEDSHPVALVALFDENLTDTPETQTMRSYLEQVAQRGMMEFFAQPSGNSTAPQSSGNTQIPAPMNVNLLRNLTGPARQTTFARWGIN